MLSARKDRAILPLRFEFPGAKLIVRVDDKFASITRNMVALPCKIDADFHAIHQLRRLEPYFLAKLYAALSRFTSADDQSFDPWKGSFGFRFLLHVEKAGVSSVFIHRMFQYRDAFRAPIYRVVPASEAPQSHGGYYALQGHSDELFSQVDFEAYSAAFFTRVLEFLASSGYQPDPFLLTATSNGLVAGFADGQYFQDHVHADVNFESAVDDFRKKGLKIVN